MNKLINVSIGLILLFAFSCTNNNADRQPDILPTISDEFNVQLWEHLSPNGSAFSLIVETIHDQECLNSVIRNEVSILGDNLAVNLNGIEHPENCLEGNAPAVADVSFASLANGNYDIAINILSLIKNEGFIEISPSALKIKLDTHDGIHIENSQLNRVPNNTFWGYIALDKLELSTTTSGFLEEIEILKDDFDFVTGEYGHFKVMEANAVDFEVNTIYPDYDKFIFKYSDEIEDLEEIIKEFREESDFENKLEIKVMTFEGLEL